MQSRLDLEAEVVRLKKKKIYQASTSEGEDESGACLKGWRLLCVALMGKQFINLNQVL